MWTLAGFLSEPAAEKREQAPFMTMQSNVTRRLPGDITFQQG